MLSSPKATKKEVVTAFRTREILAAARQIMVQRGPEAVTMEEIAAAAGVAKGTIYLYFQGKEDLIRALVSQVGQNLIREIEDLLGQEGRAAGKLRQVVAVLLDYLERERFLFPVYARDLMQGGGPARESRWPTVRGMEERFVALLNGLFAEGIRNGEFAPADPLLLTFLVRGLVRAVGYYQMVSRREDAVQATMPVIITLLTSGIIRQAAPEAEVKAI